LRAACVRRSLPHFLALGVARGEDPAICTQHLQTALELAQRYQSKALMLRAATRLCQFGGTSVTLAGAKQTLANLCDGLIEGGDTPDLIEARAALRHPLNSGSGPTPAAASPPHRR
jgi:hypothetical protein